MTDGTSAKPQRLADLEAGVGADVETLAGADAADLGSLGMRAGSRIAVLARAPLGGPIVVRLGRARVAVPRAVASGIMVRTRPAGSDR